MYNSAWNFCYRYWKNNPR